MIAAAANAVARLSDATTPGAPLLPPMTDLRTVSAAVAAAVATAAADDGLARTELTNPIQQVHEAMWRPEYPRSSRPSPCALSLPAGCCPGVSSLTTRAAKLLTGTVGRICGRRGAWHTRRWDDP